MAEKPIEVDISKEVKAILRNFKKINNEIVFHEEETSVVKQNASVIGLCTSFAMPFKFALDSMDKINKALTWANTDKIQVYQNYLHFVSDDKEKKVKVQYHDNYKCIKHVDPGFKDTIGKPDIEFSLSSRDLKDILTGNKTIEGGPEVPIRFQFEDERMNISIGTNHPNDVSDNCSINRAVGWTGEKFELIYLPEDLALIMDGDYTVSAHEQGLAVFKLKPVIIEDTEIDFGLYYFFTSGVGN